MAARIEHTILRPDATREQVTRLCEEAKHFNFAAVVVNPFHVALAARRADELDMVINIGALRSGDREAVINDIAAVVEVAHTAGGIVKVILEIAYLSDDEKKLACELCLAANADFVKTSTGFGPAGATVADVALMRRAVGNRAGVKAAGGIRNVHDAAAMIAAGADRIGASASVAIVRELGAP